MIFLQYRVSDHAATTALVLLNHVTCRQLIVPSPQSRAGAFRIRCRAHLRGKNRSRGVRLRAGCLHVRSRGVHVTDKNHQQPKVPRLPSQGIQCGVADGGRAAAYGLAVLDHDDGDTAGDAVSERRHDTELGVGGV